jgi:alpha-beta hydrolase superfamily lysophospholipase
MPEISCWNGSLVVFARGFVAPGVPLTVPLDQLTIGGAFLPAAFNALGYGFAASSYSKNGLAIVEGVNDTKDLVQNILQPILHPKRVYLIGASEGGLIAALSAEQLPQVYKVAGAACGPIGSFQGQVNYFGDFRVVFDYFFPGLIPSSPVSIPSEVMVDWDTVYVPAITAALAANPSKTAQLIKVMRAQVTSDPLTVVETVLGALWYNVFATNDAVATLSGQPFDNHDRIYTGSTNDLLLNLRIERFRAAPSALAAIAAQYETSGKLKMPMITLHTTGDPVIPYWQETLYTVKTIAAGTLLKRTNRPAVRTGTVRSPSRTCSPHSASWYCDLCLNSQRGVRATPASFSGARYRPESRLRKRRAAARRLTLGPVQNFGDFLLRDRAFLDHLPKHFGYVDGGGAGAGDSSAVEYQIYRAVHYSEDFDTAGAGGLPGEVRAGRNQRLRKTFEQCVRHLRLRLAQRQATGIACDFQRHPGGSGSNDRERPWPELPG